jgi:exoribonuclease II
MAQSIRPLLLALLYEYYTFQSSERRKTDMTKTETTKTKTAPKARKVSKKEALRRLEEARRLQRIARRNDAATWAWAGKSW